MTPYKHTQEFKKLNRLYTKTWEANLILVRVALEYPLLYMKFKRKFIDFLKTALLQTSDV